jgi:hypothetical protein
MIWRVLDFKIRMRSGRPCDEWGGAAAPHEPMRKPMKGRPGGGLIAGGLLAILSVAGPLQAKADILWSWSYVNAGAKIAASGTLTTKDLSAGSYSITSIAGLWNGAAIAGLEKVKTCCSPPGWNTNLLVDGDPKLDKGGFAFSASGGLKVNLFYKEGRYAYEIQNGPEVFGGVFVARPSGAR